MVALVVRVGANHSAPEIHKVPLSPDRTNLNPEIIKELPVFYITCTSGCAETQQEACACGKGADCETQCNIFLTGKNSKMKVKK
jgi:hypothetical protein